MKEPAQDVMDLAIDISGLKASLVFSVGLTSAVVLGPGFPEMLILCPLVTLSIYFEYLVFSRQSSSDQKLPRCFLGPGHFRTAF